MIYSNVRKLLVAGSVAGAFLASPSESKAIFHWFGSGCCGGGQTTASYAPTTAYYAPTTAYYAPTTAYYAPACNTCTPQVASYVPQTSYRTQYVNVPVTAYRPVVASDACTGCPVTVMRPVTSYVRQVQMVPYTSYRVVYSPVTSGCCTTSYYAPAAYAPAAACCAPAAPACCAPAATSVPVYPPSAAPQPPAAGSGEEPTQQPDLNLKPVLPVPGDENATPANPASTAPRLIDPSDRVTARPMPRVGVSSISLPQDARLRAPAQRPAAPPAAAPTMFDDGWRASSR
jgi:hypothetical protein